MMLLFAVSCEDSQWGATSYLRVGDNRHRSIAGSNLDPYPAQTESALLDT